MAGGFDLHALVVYILREHGPFKDTVKNFEEVLNDGGSFEIILDPDDEGNVEISIREYVEDAE
jgi:hypothetical protein